MKTTLKQFLTLGLLLPLAGCWDSGCCKKNNEHVVAQQATPKVRCSHAGCTHDHSKDTSHPHNVAAKHNEKEEAKHEHEHKHHDKEKSHHEERHEHKENLKSDEK